MPNRGKLVHVLLVEDDEIDVRAIKRGFERNHVGNPIEVARDGIEAFEVLRGEGGKKRLPRPHLILLDLNLPRMNGLEFLEALRKDPDLKSSVVFVLTTSADDKDKAAAYQQCIAGYLVKAKAGDDFVRVVQMLGKFLVTVEFPPEA